MRELSLARQAYEEALKIRRELADAEPGIYRPDVAMTLNNLGNLLGEMKELSPAREAHEQALAIFRRWAEAQPDIYRPSLATVLSNLGATLSEMGHWPEAREAYDQALVIRRELAKAEPAIYRSALAATLANVGEMLQKMQAQALEANEARLAVSRELRELGVTPGEVSETRELIVATPTRPVPAPLKWENLTDEDFERLIFSLVSTSDGYENAQWLTRTKAPDRGRDLSVARVHKDTLAGTLTSRIIIQCRHWLSKSVSDADVSVLREQVKHWEPPRVDVLIVATSGRFTADAVDLIETHNQADNALRIEMWAESHLELLLADRPDLVKALGLG
jgi:hypothetical protein